MTFTIANDEGIAAVEAFLAENSYLSGGNAPGTEDAALLDEIEAQKFIPQSSASPNLFGWWWTLSPFRAKARALWGQGKGNKGGKGKGKAAKKPEPAPAEEEDDDSFDPFADDPEADAAAEAQKKAKAAEKKNKKHPRKAQAKSILEFDVKGYEMDFDWNALAEKVRGLEINGVTWMDKHEIVPIAFGMKKLRMKCIIIDDLVQSEDIYDKIQETWEDDVQSVDTVSMNKA